MRNKYIDLSRFLAALLIMAYHTNVFFKGGGYKFQGAYIFVEFFLMVTGYFTMLHCVKEENLNDVKILLYDIRKHKKMLAYTTLTIIIHYAILLVQEQISVWEAMSFPFEILGLTQLGFGTQYVGALWYLSAVFIMLPICMKVMNLKKDKWNIIIGILPLFYYGYCAEFVGHIGGAPIIFKNLVRGAAGLLMGYNVYHISNALKANKNKYVVSLRKKWFIVGYWCTFLGVVLITAMVAATILDFFVILLFLFGLSLLFSADIKEGNTEVSTFLGKISMPMYIIHSTVQLIIETIVNNKSNICKIVVFFTMTILLSILICLIEIKWRKKYESRNYNVPLGI